MLDAQHNTISTQRATGTNKNFCWVNCAPYPRKSGLKQQPLPSAPTSSRIPLNGAPACLSRSFRPGSRGYSREKAFKYVETPRWYTGNINHLENIGRNNIYGCKYFYLLGLRPCCSGSCRFPSRSHSALRGKSRTKVISKTHFNYISAYSDVTATEDRPCPKPIL